MNIFDSQFWTQFLAIAKPYWYPNEGKRTTLGLLWSWFTLAVMLLLLLSLTCINAYTSYAVRDMIFFLEQKDAPGFFRMLLIFAALLAIYTPIVGISQYLKAKIAADWYQFLNGYILDKYFQNRAYYQIFFQSNIENPDQRISQEIGPIPKISINILFTFVEKIIEIITFTGVIWAISKPVAVFVIFYGILGNFFAGLFSQELTNINFEQLDSEANYNYCLNHIHNNAESIAFFQGEAQELNTAKQRFARVMQNFERLIGWQRNQQIFNTGYFAFLNLLPFLTVAPLYFIDQIQLGEVNQVNTACVIFSTSLSVIVNEFSNSGRLANLLNRLSTFIDALDATKTQQELLDTIETVEGDCLNFEHVTLQTPNYEQVLIQDLTVSVELGQGLLIVGSSGSGKSSLLRAIAGLWNAGTGRIIRPNLEETLFLPQRPYMILGTLREQLLYPNKNCQITDQELEQVLQQVNLSDLLTRVGSFDKEEYWEKILSLGEQQRLAFARLLIKRPSYVILDEATSALDLNNEENLYQQLQQTGATFISVGHRQSLFNYHQLVLELSEDSGWRFILS